MTIEIFDFEQGTPQWWECRRGIPTASEFAAVMAKGKGSAESKTRRTYLLKLAGEVLTGESTEGYNNVHLDRGKAMEPEARDLYAFLTEDPIRQVGFVRSGDMGCSPDALVGDTGILEIKSALPHILIDRHLAGGFPPEHKAQCQGALLVTEREWIDIAIYWPKLPLYVKRAYRDEDYLRDLKAAIDQFNEELAETVERIRNIDNPTATLRRDLEQSVLAAG